MKELLLFQTGAMQLGMDLSSVRSIQSMPGTLSKQPEKRNLFAPLTGDQDISLVNLSAILGDKNSSADSGNEKLIVINTQDKPVGLIVERVDRVIKADMDRIEPLSPIFQGPALSCFPKVLKHEGKLVLLLAPQRMVDIVRQMQKSQADATSSAVKPDPVIQQRTPAGVLYKKYGETVVNPDHYMNSGRPE
jgi:chemotaxis signal transduction protein